MNKLATTRVSELVITYPHVIPFFESNKIDFCCNGQKVLENVLEERNLSSVQKREFYNSLNAKIASDLRTEVISDFSYSNLIELCNYIKEKHHTYVVNTSDLLQKLFTQTMAAHLQSHPELKEASENFNTLIKELKIHLSKEETSLFPMIRYMEDCKRFDERPHTGRKRPWREMIDTMSKDHIFAGNKFETMRSLLHDYQHPPDACPTYIMLLNKLDEFEKDLHVHIHIENNILFPGVFELENFIFNNN